MEPPLRQQQQRTKVSFVLFLVGGNLDSVQFPRNIVTVGEKASSSSTDKVLLNKRGVPVTATDFKHIPNATRATNPS